MATIAERVFDVLRDMQEQDAGEVLDFAEFLKFRRGHDETAYLLREPANARRLLSAAANRREEPNEGLLPESLIGCLKHSLVFGGRDPLEIQREMREEWER